MVHFLVYAPAFDAKSGGVVVLHLLNKSLNDIGYNSKIIEFGQSISEYDAQRNIIIYPEIIHNNPLGGKFVCRYLLNKDGALWGKKIERNKDDFLFTYSKAYDSSVPLLFCPLIDLNKLFFEDMLSGRELHSVYFGKGPILSMSLDGTIPHLFITRKWPENRDLLFEFFRMSRFFHCSDAVSAILHEALLCGATPVIHHWPNGFVRQEFLESELPEVYEMQVEQDFSVENTLHKARRLRERIQVYQADWPKTLNNLVCDIKAHFGM